MSRTTLALSVAAVLVVSGRTPGQQLSVGDPAPKLEVKEFIKGEPVESFEMGKVYVVVFWATWCGPCKTSIPHLSELQKKHKDVVFIGVSVWEDDQSKVKPFVEEMGEKMAYRIALDDTGGKGREGKMGTNWMRAADFNALPTAFIVNGDGKIAWAGNAALMDEPFAQIVAGKWDLSRAAADFKKESAERAKLRALLNKIVDARQSGDNRQLLAVLEEGIKENPDKEVGLGRLKLQTLAALGDTEKTLAYGRKYVDGVLKDSPHLLSDAARVLVEKPGDKPDAKLMKFALEVAQKAHRLAEGKDATIASTLAKAYFENGDAAKALEHQERALKLAKGTPQERDQGMLDRLELYRKKAGKD